MRATDAWAATIRAGGRVRSGAKMVVLDASHPDILEFIAAKTREKAAAGHCSPPAIRFTRRSRRSPSSTPTTRLQRRSLLTYLSQLIATHTRGDPFPALAA
jgi:Ribonucleotide reductase, barrel domain